MKKQIFFWSLVSALAGFLFGFDTVVISGAERRIQALWGLSAGLHGFAIGSALYALTMGLLNNFDLDKVHTFAAQVASFVCSHVGATPVLPERLRNKCCRRF